MPSGFSRGTDPEALADLVGHTLECLIELPAECRYREQSVVIDGAHVMGEIGGAEHPMQARLGDEHVGTRRGIENAVVQVQLFAAGWWHARRAIARYDRHSSHGEATFDP